MRINKRSIHSNSHGSLLSRGLKQLVPLAFLGYLGVVLWNGSMSEDDAAVQVLSSSETSSSRSLSKPVATTTLSAQNRHLESFKQSSSSSSSGPTMRRRLLPGDVVSRIGPKSSSSSRGLWKNGHNVVHVINTRVLQDQNKLVHLAQARLSLLETFTVPSVQHQTNQQFLWLLWTDAHLDASLQKQLLRIVKPVSNAVVIGLTQDKDSTLRQLYGHSWTALSASVKAGSHKLLADYSKASQSHLLLETRLDADDALSHSLVESIQAQAAAAMGQQSQSAGASQVFCPESHVEWRYYSEEDDIDSAEAQDDSKGKLIHYHNKDFCIFSGMTWAYNVGKDDTGDDRRLQAQGANNQGNNCIIDETEECPDDRRLNQLFDQQVVQPAHNKLRRLNTGPSCELFDVACYQCDTSLTCVVADHGRDPQKVADVVTYLSTAGLRTAGNFFCAIAWGNRGTTCSQQQCMPHGASGVTPEEYLQADTLSNLFGSGETCPVLNGQCFTGSGLLRSFATYRIGHCTADGYVGVEQCGGRCGWPATPGSECQCQHGWSEFCGGCDNDDDDDDDDDDTTPPNCRRQLRLVTDRHEQFEATFAASSVPAASVLLARTPTAAGMKNVVPETKGGGQHSLALDTFQHEDAAVQAQLQAAAWSFVERDFGVASTAVERLRRDFEGNMEPLLIDAFAGQCTPGHSCKESTKRALGYLLDKVQRRSRRQNK